MSTVKIQLRDTRVAVYVNGALACTAAREDRSVYRKAIVYAADPCVQNFMFFSLRVFVSMDIYL